MTWAEVVGDPVAHSKSPLIHGHWLALAGIAAEYRATRVTPAELPEWVAARRADASWMGANLTMPLKQAVVPLLDSLSPDAARLGAVNTVVRDGDRLVGHNSDVDGVAEPLLRHSKPDYPNHVATYVQVVGAGGAARAAWAGAVKAGYGDFDFYNRTAAKAVEMARLAGLPDWSAAPLEQLGPARNPDDGLDDQRYSHVVINATAMGMHGQNPVPIRLQDYYPDTLVFDMVYQPLETPLLAAARHLGLRTIDGLEMLVAQAATAFTLLFGHPPDRSHDAELRRLLTS